MDAPRESLVRANFTRAQVENGRTLTGYPIVFDQWTEINGWEGNFKERISPTALKKTLREQGDQVKVLFNHGMDPAIGDKPLGKPSVMRADQTGLYVEVPLSDTSYNDDLLALMRDGALDGQSFRFSVVQEEWNTPKRGLPERTITELRLFEFGPVTFPAYKATTVGIRSRERFADWLGLDEDRRNQIEAIFERTEAGETTSAASETPDLEPQVQHSSDMHLTRHRALAALAKLKETQ